MEFSESESVDTFENVKPELALPQTPEEPLENHSTSSSSKQQSIFTLTLDEIQSKSGRSFGSMNMDEFLNSVWPSEENQQVASNLVNLNEPIITNDENEAPLPQTNFAVPTPLSSKTVEEVWAEIQQNSQEQQNLCLNFTGIINNSDSLGEMTLEDFLVKAGVIRESPAFPPQPVMTENLQNNSGGFLNNTGLDNNAGTGQVIGGYEISNPPNSLLNGNVFLGNGPSSCGSNGNTSVANGSSLYPMFPPGNGGGVGEPSTINGHGNGRSNSPSEASEPNTRRRTSALIEVAVERRQHRMIKNRESAARSRARKQAYTAELEIELNNLREENERLKLTLAEVENRQKLETIEEDQSRRRAMKLKTMRRTLSLSW